MSQAPRVCHSTLPELVEISNVDSKPLSSTSARPFSDQLNRSSPENQSTNGAHDTSQTIVCEEEEVVSKCRERQTGKLPNTEHTLNVQTAFLHAGVSANNNNLPTDSVQDLSSCSLEESAQVAPNGLALLHVPISVADVIPFSNSAMLVDMASHDQELNEFFNTAQVVLTGFAEVDPISISAQDSSSCSLQESAQVAPNGLALSHVPNSVADVIPFSNSAMFVESDVSNFQCDEDSFEFKRRRLLSRPLRVFNTVRPLEHGSC